MSKLKSYLQLCRAQTAPATVLLTLVAYLAGNPISWGVVVLVIYAFLIHLFSFGENSLLDYAMGYDKTDENKQHHPLNSGEISLQAAHNVIHWGLIALSVVGAVITYLVSPNPTMAMAALVIWLATGHAYNEGLSKESVFGFIPISVCFTSMAAWAWFLGHTELTTMGMLYLCYVFMTILFQISWSGHLKEMSQAERSNLLIRMGAKLDNGWFDPGNAFWYGAAVKYAGIAILFAMSFLLNSLWGIAWFIIMYLMILFFLTNLLKSRPYDRPAELKNMSIMEILSIYAPMPLMLPWLYSAVLMILGAAYFLGVNRWLWQSPYPRV